MIMQNSVLDPQDQRNTSSMEDSNAMTIEFLRARLLSERSLSRSTRQRADELAKKVMELEEQLRMVTLQRKKAEKATADVLAILENQGISDVSEEFDLGSDVELPCEFGVSNDSKKGGERSMSSRGRRQGSDELPGSDVDSSPVCGRSLSWKGRVDSPRSIDKYKTSNLRRRSSFSSVSSSPKHCLGKSCRQIRHKQSRSVVEESRDEVVKVNCQENEVGSFSERFSNSSDGLRIESKNQEGDELEVKVANKSLEDEYGREENMEKALEHQAHLIDHYEAMEKAQSEWEEKFRENNSTTPDSCDLGNHSDMTEERDDSKAQTPCSARVITSNTQEDKSEARGVHLSKEMLKGEPRDNISKSYDDTSGYNNQKNTTFSTSGLLGQEISHSLLKGNQNESSVNSHHQPVDRHHEGPNRHGYPDARPTDSFPAYVHGGLHQNHASRNKNDLYALVSYEQPHQFSGVLESLKQARLSLQLELNRLPLVESGYTGKAINPSTSVSKSEDRFNIPVGCSGLFRVPTDFSVEPTARFNVHDPTSGFSSNFYLDGGMPRTSGLLSAISPYSGAMPSFSADDQSLATRYSESMPSTSGFSSNFYLDGGMPRTSGLLSTIPPYSGAMPSFSADDQSLATRYSESMPRFDIKKPPFGPFSVGGLPSFDNYMYPTFPIFPSYQNATTQMSFREGISRPISSSTVGVPLAFHGDHSRENMYI